MMPATTLSPSSGSSLVGGAGALVRIDEACGGDAYLVTPAAHIGRVVTGVVLLAESPATAATPTARPIEKLGGLASVAFADKLAEQGYKVLLIEAASIKIERGDLPATAERAEHAAAFLKRQHDIQRVALVGVGVGADVAIHIVVTSDAAASASFECFVALSPDGRVLALDDAPRTAPLPPTLVLVGGKTGFARSDSLTRLVALYDQHPPAAPAPLPFRSRVFPSQGKGFAFSGITDEDAATQAIAEILDWLVLHLHRFRTAACTSDTDPWWPQGRNGPFCNIGQKAWQDSRNDWLTATTARPPRPPPVPSHVLFDGLSSMRRTFELPHRMALGDVVELFVEIWEVQQ